jgi:hypothetical protein
MDQNRFLKACKNGDITTLKSLDYSKIDIHAYNEHAFQHACSNGHLNIVKFLLSSEETHRHINIHADDELAFRLACENGHLPIVKYLISLEPEYGLDICARNGYIFECSNFQIRHLLIQNYPNYNWKQVNGYYDYCTLNQIINNLSLLHQNLIQLRTDILELNVIGIVKEFLM